MSEKIYKAAAYCRLSKEDDTVSNAKKKSSNSIQSQKSIISNFVKTQDDIDLVCFYVDDGFSGLNFNRPDFLRMMEDVNEGLINCIIVKDSSRLGRDHLAVGIYLERVFPDKGIRFISVSDHYDSLTSDDFSMHFLSPIRNLMNEAYSADISKKIRTSLAAKRKQGDYVGAWVVYGYKKADNHNVIVPDEEAAQIVRLIFQWITQGYSLAAISDKLNENGTLSPLEYKIQNGEKISPHFRKNETAKWSPVAVRRIAENEIYTGTLIQGKTENLNYKMKKKIKKQPDDWDVIPNHHTAIISQAEYDTVQRLLAKDMRTGPGQEVTYLLSGITVCADCGSTMVRKKTTVGQKKYIYYMCSGYKNNQISCTSHRVREDVVIDAVLTAINQLIAVCLECEVVLQQVEDEVKKRDFDQYNDAILHDKKNKIKKYTEMLSELYEDKADGLLDTTDFQIIKQDIINKINMLEKSMKVWDKKTNGIHHSEELRYWIKFFKEHKKIHTLTRQLTVSLIREIRVKTNKEIELVFNCADEFQYLIDQAKKYGDKIRWQENQEK